MRLVRTGALVLLAMFGVALAACSTTAAARGACDLGAGDAYPCEPYGLTVGSTIANLSIVGRRDTNRSGNVLDDTAQSIALAAYRAEGQAQALAIVIGSESCVPCQNEQPELITLFEQHAGKLALLEAIVEDAVGAPASPSVIDNWVKRFAVPFDMTADPTSALAPYYPASSYPSAMLIRLADMQITYLVVGPAVGLDAAIAAVVK